MNHWILSNRGYTLMTYTGQVVFYDTMAVNMKAYIKERNIEAVVVNNKTSGQIIREFDQATGRKYVRKT